MHSYYIQFQVTISQQTWNTADSPLIVEEPWVFVQVIMVKIDLVIAEHFGVGGGEVELFNHLL